MSCFFSIVYLAGKNLLKVSSEHALVRLRPHWFWLRTRTRACSLDR